MSGIIKYIKEIANSPTIGPFGEILTGRKQDDIAVQFQYPFYNEDFDMSPAVVTGAGTVEFKLIKNGGLSGAGTFNDIDADNSVIEFDNTVNYTAGGREITIEHGTYTGSGATKIGAGASELTKDLEINLLPGETATLIAQNVAGSTNVGVRADLIWGELF